ncbi:IPT/TIG domain-containing protein [Mucilaginibacter antarcticus]|uniref:IPT/TIG domain-containing protein n=1 Tax=Mucilaginibacter antarcticus TaxID=1855725 RepID=UPI00362EB9A0
MAGTNFSTALADNLVKFNTVQATVISATATKLMVIAPQGGTSGDLTLKVKNSEQITGPAFNYIIPATFTALTPASGAVGDVITLTGTNFSTTLADNLVTFSGVAGQVKTATATTITVAVPVGAITGAVTVTVKGKRAALAQGFTPTFTVTTTQPPANPTVIVGDPGQAYILNGSYSAFAKASDNEGNLYVVDENQQLYKMSPSGQILKSFTKNDIIFKAMNSYKCIAITSNKKGAIRALFYCPTFPNGQVEMYMVAIGISGTISKEFITTFSDTNVTGMVWDNSNYYVLSSNFNTDDVVKIGGTDGAATQYLKGGANGDFNGNGAYSMDLDGSNNMFVLTYTKGPNSSSIPTKHAIFKFDPNKTKSTILASYNDGYTNGDWIRRGSEISAAL